MENKFAKHESGVKEKKEHSPKATDWQAYIVKLTVPTNKLINWQAYCENNSTNELKSCSRQHSGTPHSTSEIQPMVVLFYHHRGGIRGANSGLTAVYTE